MEELVLVSRSENGQAVTSSLIVAQKFGKKHKHVNESIRKVMASAEKSAHMFEETTYLDEQGKSRTMYLMNRDGFTLLAMGFTGAKAMQFKMDYINAFNKMEEVIRNQQDQKKLSPVEMFALQAQINLENEKRIEKVENGLQLLLEEREQNRQLLENIELSQEELPEETESSKIRKLVDVYVRSSNLSHKETWDAIYNTLEYRYGNRIRAYRRTPADRSLLDVAIRNNLGQKVYNVISDMVRHYTKQNNV